MSNLNPYAAPQADDDRTARDADKLTQAQRTNRIGPRHGTYAWAAQPDTGASSFIPGS